MTVIVFVVSGRVSQLEGIREVNNQEEDVREEAF